jgi:hypothetical protein
MCPECGKILFSREGVTRKFLRGQLNISLRTSPHIIPHYSLFSFIFGRSFAKIRAGSSSDTFQGMRTMSGISSSGAYARAIGA